jgi:hypothetical protein
MGTGHRTGTLTTVQEVEKEKTRVVLETTLWFNSLPGKSLLAGAKLVLFGRYILNFHTGIDK